MIRLVLVAVFDAAATVYLPPFGVLSDGEGIRAFGDEVKRVGSPMGEHPEDYSLFRLGVLDRSSGMLYPEVAPVCLVTGVQARGLLGKLEAVS